MATVPTRPALPRGAGRTRVLAAVRIELTVAAEALRGAGASDPGRFLAADERAYATLAVDLARRGEYGSDTLKHPFRWAPRTPALFGLADVLSLGADDLTLGRLHSAPWAQTLVGTVLIPATVARALLFGVGQTGLAAAVALR